MNASPLSRASATRILPWTRAVLVCMACACSAAFAQTPGTAAQGYASPTTTGFQSWVSLDAQADGKVLAAGIDRLAARGAFSVWRFDNQGVPDASFGDGGRASVMLYPGNIDVGAHRVKVDPRGLIHVFGSYQLQNLDQTSPAETGFAVARLLPNGALDTSYGDGGVVKFAVTAATGPDTEIEALFRSLDIDEIALQPDGRLLLIGTAARHGDPADSNSLLVVRLTRDGRIDTSFGGTGYTLTRLDEAVLLLSDVAVNSAGAIFVAGDETQPYEAVVFKLTPQGTRDASFGTNGMVRFSESGTEFSVASGGIALHDEGLVVSAARRVANVPGPDGNGAPWDSIVARLTANGSLDPAFGSGGISNPEGGGIPGIEPTGAIVLADTTLTRMAPDGTVLGSAPLTAGRVDDLVIADATYALAVASSTRIHKFYIDPAPRSDSLSTGETPSLSEFRVEASSANGTQVETATRAQLLGLNGYIYPESSDIGAAADLFVVANTSSGWYMRTVSGAFVPWSGRVSELMPAYESSELLATTYVPIYAGHLPFTGTYALYLGYMRTGGPLIYSVEPGMLSVTN